MNVIHFVSVRHCTARLGLLFSVALFPIACGSDKARVYPVRGEVFVNGKPAPGALVHLHPRDKQNGRPAFATVQQDGSFQLTTYATNDGAVPGEYAVTVNWYDERKDEGETIYSADKLRGRFTNVEKSGLSATVNVGGNDLPRFDLK